MSGIPAQIRTDPTSQGITWGEFTAFDMYRATVTWSGKSTDVRIGRQRIPLGTRVILEPGQGTVDPERYDLNVVLSGRALNLGRWSGAVAVSYDVRPLFKVRTYGVWNAGDGSLVLCPRLEWSAKANLDLVAGIQQRTGSARSEYGRRSSLAHGEVRWFY